MHDKGLNSREIPACCWKDGESFQGIHSPTYRNNKEHRDTQTGKSCSQESGATTGCIFLSYQRPLRKNSQARAKNDKHYTKRRLESTNHGIPSSPLLTRQQSRVDQNAAKSERIPNYWRCPIQDISHRATPPLP
jgi:hypothetical protein